MSGDPYRLIEEMSLCVRRRMRENLLLPVLPPAVAIVAAAVLGRLPIELADAATIGLGLVLVKLVDQRFERLDAAAFLDRELHAKQHFLTLATVRGDSPLRPAVESQAAAVIDSAPAPAPPPRRTRPAILSSIASALLFAFLWWLPQLPTFASGGGTLDHLAAELGASSDATDRELARSLKTLSDSLRDPKLSKDEKRKLVAEMIDKIEKAEQAEKQRQQQSAASGSSGSGGSSGKQGEQEKPDGQQQGEGKQSSAKQQPGNGQQSSGSGARGEARKELEKIAGEMSGGSEPQQAKSDQGEKKKQDPSGGGIKGPEDEGAKERKPSEKDATGNQPGKSPEKSGGNEKPGGAEGQAKAEQGQQPQPNPANQGKGQGQGGGSGEGAGNQPSRQDSDKPADRYFKPGEGPGGRIADGRYVQMRIPEEEQRQLQGTEEVAKPGDVVPEVAYGNAPLPPPGAPGDVGTDQPVPLEYRGALGSPSQTGEKK